MTSGLKILLTTYSTAYLTSGGGEVEIIRTAEMLRGASALVDIYGPASRPLKFYDFIIHFSVEASGAPLFFAAKEAGKKIFIYPNVWWLEAPSPVEIERVKALVLAADKVIFKSRAEIQNFSQYISLPHDSIAVSRLPISPSFSQDIDMELAMAYTDKLGYALCVGLLEPIKNQLEVIRALNTLSMSGVFVGGTRDEEYARQCKLEAHHGIKFLPFIPSSSSLLRSIIGGASVLVEPSLDPPGRSVLEGAILKRPVVIARSEWQKEYFSDNCWVVSPNSYEDIAKGVLAALNDSDRTVRIKNAYEYFLSNNLDHLVGTGLINSVLGRDD
jgi:glycosyltransferase involved in cell wall biosynthesis